MFHHQCLPTAHLSSHIMTTTQADLRDTFATPQTQSHMSFAMRNFAFSSALMWARKSDVKPPYPRLTRLRFTQRALLLIPACSDIPASPLILP